MGVPGGASASPHMSDRASFMLHTRVTRGSRGHAAHLSMASGFLSSLYLRDGAAIVFFRGRRLHGLTRLRTYRVAHIGSNALAGLYRVPGAAIGFSHTL